MEEKETLLRELYYSPETGYKSTEHLWQLAKEKIEEMDLDISISRNFVKQWLQRQSTYTKFKKWNNPKHYRHTFVRDFGQIQMDLIELPAKQIEDGYKFILTAIDILSRFAFAYPQKNKSAKSTEENMEKVLDKFEEHFHKDAILVQTDDGKEFNNKSVKEYLDSRDIHWFSVRTPRKASIVERFNRTLKTKMWKMFNYQGNYSWVDKLDSLVRNYNNTVHRSIGMKPDEVSEDNKHTVWLRLFGHMVNIKKPKFKVGDRVRILFFGGETPRYRELQMGQYFKKNMRREMKQEN